MNDLQQDRQQLDDAIKSTTKQLGELLKYSKEVIGSMRLKKYVKQKTVYRMNIYSAIYQRVQSFLFLIEKKQANTASILVRSTWEMLVAHDYVGMHKGNYYLEILRAIEMKSVNKQWKAIKKLREKYPDSETWRKQWSDELVDERIAWSDTRMKSFNNRNPKVNLGKHDRLLNRLESLDDYNLMKNPKYSGLTQMDYRTVYSVLSEDVHSTIYGTKDNSRATIVSIP